MSESRDNGTLENFRLTETIHSKGINCRYLGLVRRALEDPDFRTIVLIDILARCIKNNLRLKLRLRMKILKKPLEEPYRRLVIKYMNLCFGNSAASNTYWNDSLKSDIKRNFILALTKEEEATEYSLKRSGPDTNFLRLLLGRLEKMMGIRFASRIKTNPHIFLSDQPFNETDLETLPLRVKHMNIVNTAEGTRYIM